MGSPGERGGTGLVTGVYARVPEGPGGDPWGLREMKVGMGGVGRELVGWWSQRGLGGSKGSGDTGEGSPWGPEVPRGSWQGPGGGLG